MHEIHMKKCHIILFIVYQALQISCGSVEIKSTPPEAEILVAIPGKEEAKVLGKTPYKERLGQLSDIVNQGTIVVTVKKEGYIPQDYIVPNLSSGNLTIEANLKPYIASNYRETNKIISLAFKAERMVMEKRYKEASEEVKKIKDLNENVAIAYQLMGTILFFEQKFKESYYEWLRSLELEPDNNESQEMLTLIEKKLNPNAGPPKS